MPLEPPSDETQELSQTARSGPATPGRRLRARRVEPALRLLEHGDGGALASGAARLDLTSADPLALMRLSGQDLDAGMRAIRVGARPTAVVTGLGEARETTASARRLARNEALAWLADPVLFRAALEGYRTASTLQTLDYTPGRDGDPYRSEEFEDRDLLRRIGRSVVGAQVDLLAAAAFSGSFVVNGMADPWLGVNQGLLRNGADAAAAWDVPLIATLPLRMSGFDEIEAQRLLVRALAARRPAAWLLMADGVADDSGVDRIVATLRLALLLQAASAPVILARAGDLRRLFWAFGVAGAEFGLGRMLRFSVPDFRKRRRGPGPMPGPRVELPSLMCSVPFERARRLLGSELVAEVECACPACSAAGSVDAQLAVAAEHDAHVVTGEANAWRGQPVQERVAELERGLTEAAVLCNWADAEAQLGVVRAGVERQRRVLHAAVEAGLLEPAQLAAELRLFD